MHLYLVRHGLANWSNFARPDGERPLNPEGAQQIAKVAKALHKHAVQPDLILHSPLMRAYETALIIAEELGLTVKPHRLLAPGFDVPALHKILSEQAAAKHLMLVGHNPDMSEMVTALTDELARFKEGSIAHLKVDRDAEPLTAKLIWFKTPKDW